MTIEELHCLHRAAVQRCWDTTDKVRVVVAETRDWSAMRAAIDEAEKAGAEERALLLQLLRLTESA